MNLSKRIATLPWMQKCVGIVAAEYLRLVRNTCSFGIDPPDIYDRVTADLPVIFALWHGQQFMAPFFRHERWRVKSLVSRHRDGEIIATATQRLGIEAIRGSGTRGRDIHNKGGVAGFRQMLRALAQGCNVALTADVPKDYHIVGRGLIELARLSGRPIYPFVPATSRRVELNNWDRAAINLPFGRFVVAVAEPIRVAADADDATIEEMRRLVELRLNDAAERAYAIVEGRAKDFDWNRRRQRRTQSA